MSDLISRSALIEKLYAKANEWRGSYSGDAYAAACQIVKKEPGIAVKDIGYPPCHACKKTNECEATSHECAARVAYFETMYREYMRLLHGEKEG